MGAGVKALGLAGGQLLDAGRVDLNRGGDGWLRAMGSRRRGWCEVPKWFDRHINTSFSADSAVRTAVGTILAP